MPTASENSLRLALVGVGPWGTLLGTKFQQAGAVIAYHVREKGQAVEKFGSRIPLERLFETPDFSGVILATPPKVTLSLATALAERGVGVLACKPVWLAEPIRLNAPFLVDYVRLWSPAYVLLKHLIQGHRIIRIDGIFVGNGPYRDFSSLDDYGSHILALTHDILGSNSVLEDVVTHSSFQDALGGTVHECSGTFLTDTKFSLLAGNGSSEKRLRFNVEVDSLGVFTYGEDAGQAFLLLNGSTLHSAPHDPITTMAGLFIEQCRRNSTNAGHVNLSAAVHRTLQAIHYAANAYR